MRNGMGYYFAQTNERKGTNDNKRKQLRIYAT